MKKPSDNLSQKYPVSIKGVVFINKKVLLLKNDRDEYELPGGKLEINEQPMLCLKREIEEEANIIVTVEKIIDSWLYHIDKDTHVVIITYGCFTDTKDEKNIKISAEHKALKLASLYELRHVNMPTYYKDSIKSWNILIENQFLKN